jgi:cell cycle arrest protein BUB3
MRDYAASDAFKRGIQVLELHAYVGFHTSIKVDSHSPAFIAVVEDAPSNKGYGRRIYRHLLYIICMSGIGIYELKAPPKDGISSVHFYPNEGELSNRLLVTSWDGFVRWYDVVENRVIGQVATEMPLLDGCWSDAVDNGDNGCWVGGLSGKVLGINMAKEQIQTELGTHSGAIKALLHDRWNTKCLITGGWDSMVKVWDPRVSDPLIYTLEQPERVYSMDLTSNGKLVVATAGRRIQVYDMRKLPVCMQQRDSCLKHQTRCIKCSDVWDGFLSSSIEGRVAVEYFLDDPVEQGKKYAFKCHRSNSSDIETIYPVNALAFHPKSGAFVTGGSDGVVCVWDGLARKRIKAFPPCPTSIASLDFNADGSMLAIASSYMYEEGEKDHPLDTVFIRAIHEADIKIK